MLSATVFFIFGIGFGLAVREQAVHVKGRLLCGTYPASPIPVKLMDEDRGPDPDDLLSEGFTDSNGNFDLEGSTHELTAIEPVIKIYHDCDDSMKPGRRVVKLKIPEQYVAGGTTAKKVFDFGVLNLETIFPNEERELF